MKKTLAIVCVIVLLWAATSWLCSFEHRKNQLLSENLTAKSDIHFQCPQGGAFRLVFGAEPDYVLPHEFRAVVTFLRPGAQVLRIPIESEGLQPADWLESAGLSAFVLNCDDPNWDLMIMPGEFYDVTVELNGSSGSELSLWLSYGTTTD